MTLVWHSYTVIEYYFAHIAMLLDSKQLSTNVDVLQINQKEQNFKYLFNIQLQYYSTFNNEG